MSLNGDPIMLRGDPVILRDPTLPTIAHAHYQRIQVKGCAFIGCGVQVILYY